MKVAVVFVLLFVTVLCLPARKVPDSSSESSEEVVRQPAAPVLRKQAAVFSEASPIQSGRAAPSTSSDESTESSDEDELTAAVQFKSDGTASSSDTSSVSSNDSEDSDDDDDEENETQEEDDDSSDSSESGEASTAAPTTPVIVTDETTPEPIEPTIVTDTDTGRGDNLGGYPGDYKNIIYVEDKSYHKSPGPYKSYEFVDSGKKTAYDVRDRNEVDKSLQVYKVQALQVHSDFLEEDASTPEVESQGLDSASQDQKKSSDATTSESKSSSTAEDEEKSASSASESASASQESEDEESKSSEEATNTPGAADSQSDESESSEGDSIEEGAGPDAGTDMLEVVSAK